MRRLSLAILFVALAIIGSSACGYGGAPGGGNQPGAASTPSY
jgi:hypothetical protein